MKTNEKLSYFNFILAIGAFAIGMTEFVLMGILPDVAQDLKISITKAGQFV